MPANSPFQESLARRIAEDLGIQPEQVTIGFIHEMRKRMYRDPQHQWDYSTGFLHDPQVRYPTADERKQWNEKCRVWAQEVLAKGPTPCGFKEEIQTA